MAELRVDMRHRLFISGAALVAWCWLGLLSVIVASALGGQAFKESVYGDTAMAIFLLGFFLGCALIFFGLVPRARETTQDAEA